MLRHWREAALVAAGGSATLAAYAAIYFPFLPTAAGTMGHDWAYYLPQQLAGLYWLIESGPLAIPWFTPGFCGGVPFYANPNSTYVSLPQALVWWLDPTTAARVTLVAFAAAGLAGTYGLLRRVFETSAAAAFLGAVLFATNGFFGARLIIGHIGFHGFMLAPLIAWLVLARSGDVFASVAAGLAFAYGFQSGAIHVIPVTVLAIAGLYCLDGWRRGFSWRPPARLAAATAVALALSAAKLSANLAFLANFPRTGYPIPGATGVVEALRLAVMGLFGEPSSEAAMRVITNARFALGRHEFEFGVTWVAPAVIAGGAVVALARGRLRGRPGGDRLAAAVGLALVLAVPIALTVYAPEWHAALKRLPLIASASNLFRWYAAYIPLVAVAAALAFDAIPWRGAVALAASAGLAAGVLVLHWLPDRGYYAAQSYRPGTIAAAMRLARATERAQPVDTVATVTVVDGKARLKADRNDAIALGSSPPLCYEPLFGYGLERFPLGPLRPGSVFARVGDGEHYNLKNPACYVFPGANGCRPGDHFRLDQRPEMVRFLAYRPFAFAEPWWQRLAEVLNLAALAGIVLLTGYGLALPRERRP